MPADFNAIQAEQEAYFNEPTGTQNPDGSDVKRGHYKQVSPVNVGDVQVDVYDGPNGCGYVVIETRVDADGTWKKATNFGPETARSHDWKLAT